MYGPVRCEACGKVDPTLRYSVFTKVVSVLIFSHRSQRGGVYCVDCRAALRTRYSLLTGLLGWWGVPWGLFWTIGGLVDNLAGGKQDPEVNAPLLRVLGLQLAQEGRMAEAIKALAASQQMKYDPDAAIWIEQIANEIGISPPAVSLPLSSGITPARPRLQGDGWKQIGYHGASQAAKIRRKPWVLVPVGILLLMLLRPHGNSGLSHEPAVPTQPIAAAPWVKAPVTMPADSSYVHVSEGFGFVDDFEDTGGSASVYASTPGSVQGKYYKNGTDGGPFNWIARIGSVSGDGSVCISLTARNGEVWYFNVNPSYGTWSLDRASDVGEVFSWVNPTTLPYDEVGRSIQTIEVRVRSNVPIFLVNGHDVSSASGISLPAVAGRQQPGFCASLTNQYVGTILVQFNEVELVDVNEA